MGIDGCVCEEVVGCERVCVCLLKRKMDCDEDSDYVCLAFLGDMVLRDEIGRDDFGRSLVDGLVGSDHLGDGSRRDFWGSRSVGLYGFGRFLSFQLLFKKAWHLFSLCLINWER